MNKRFFCFFLIVCVIASLPFCVYASSTESTSTPEDSLTNLLDHATYDIRLGLKNQGGYTTISDYAYPYYTDYDPYSFISFSFDVPYTRYSNIFFFLKVPSNASAVRIYCDDTLVSSTVTGSSGTTNRVITVNKFVSNIRVEFQAASANSLGSVPGIIGCFGNVHDIYDVSSFTSQMWSYYAYISDETIEGETGVRMEEISPLTERTGANVFNIIQDATTAWNDVLTYTTIRYTVDVSDLGADVLEWVNFDLMYYGSILEVRGYVTSSSDASSNYKEPIYTLNVATKDYPVSPDVGGLPGSYPFSNFDWPLQGSSFELQTAGLDLLGRYLVLEVDIESLMCDEGRYFMVGCITNPQYKVDLDSNDSALSRIISILAASLDEQNNIGSQLEQINSTLQLILNKINGSSSVIDYTGQLDAILVSLGDIEAVSRSILNAILTFGNTNQTNLNLSVNNMNTIAPQIQQNMQVIQSVSKPTTVDINKQLSIVNSAVTQAQGVPNPQPGVTPANPLTITTPLAAVYGANVNGGSYVGGLMALVAALALCGYVLFGKK